MQHYLFLINSFRLLWSHKPGKLFLIFGLTLFQGINSGFSIVMLIPLLQQLNIGNDTSAGAIGEFIQKITTERGITLTIESILVIYISIFTITALIQYWKSIIDARYQQTFIYDIRQRLFRKIILADWAVLNNKSKTNHLQVLTKEVPNLANYFYFYLRLITTVILAFSYIGYSMLVSVKFTLLIIVIGLLLFIFLRKFLFKAFHLGEGIVNSYNQLLKYIDDFWQTVKIAKVHSSEAFYYKKFDEASTSLLDLEFRMQKNYSLPQLIYRISGILVLVLVVYLGYRVEQIPLASFFILILLFSRIYPQFVSINTDVNMIISNVASVKLVMELDASFAEGKFHQPVNTENIRLKQEIKLENIRFSYPDGEQLFRDFSATIPANRMTGIVGASGRGKTTLIDLIAGLQKPVSGNISIDGIKLTDNQLPGWKNSIGYLPQDAFFIDGTLRENLVWDSPENVSDEEIHNVLEQVNALHLIKRFEKGLDEQVVNYQFNFSGGEMQRLALARVLLRKPRLLLLDEATSSLDSDNENQIMEVLNNLKNKVTILFVTHRTSVLPWFDKVIEIGLKS
jgi:ATP-binding cassette subfamily C protein